MAPAICWNSPGLSLQVTLLQNEMQMKLINGKVSENNVCKKEPGIGISNVEKRLELLYPGKHQLVITNDEDVFVVNLKIELEQIKDQPCEPSKRTTAGLCMKPKTIKCLVVDDEPPAREIIRRYIRTSVLLGACW